MGMFDANYLSVGILIIAHQPLYIPFFTGSERYSAIQLFCIVSTSFSACDLNQVQL
jgi:hypothetical protein